MKRCWKRLAALLLTGIMLVQANMIFAVEVEYDDADTKSQEVVLEEEGTIQISSNPSVFDVPEDESVQDEQTTTEEIVLQEDEAAITVAEPRNLEVVPSENEIVLFWDAVPTADCYNIYRTEYQDNSDTEVVWMQLGNTQECTYTDQTAISGVTYQYGVSAVSGEVESTYAQHEKSNGYEIMKSEETDSESTATEEVYAQTVDSDGSITEESEEEEDESSLPTITILSEGDAEDHEEVSALTEVEGLAAVSTAYNSIKISWNAKAGANGYLLYYKTSKSGTWKLLKELSATQLDYTDSLSCGSTRYYTVCAYRMVDGSRQIGERNETGVSAKAVPSASTVSVKRKTATTLSITWSKVTGATGYRLYRRKNETDKWTLIKTVTSGALSYDDTKRSCGVSYSYAVQTYRVVDGSKIWGKYSKSVTGQTYPNKGNLSSISISTTKNAKLKWNKIAYATGYQVARKTGANGSYTVIGTTAATTYTDKNLTGFGTVYYYRFRPYITVNGKKVYGPWSTGKSYTHYAYKYYINAKKIPEEIDLPGVKQFQYGKSGQGRPLYAYQIGNGSKHMVLNFAIHGWEDHWKADGYELTRVAVKLLEKLSAQQSALKNKNWTIVVIPSANPDGYYNGTTCNGPGRCTTRRYNSSGKLVKGGVDLNRSFPAGFYPRYNSRNYTGPRSLMTREGKALRDLLVQYDNNKKNIYFDVHGWTQQILTNRSGSGTLYKTMHKYFPQNSAGNNGGSGYATYYARTLGYDACLFEFPRSVTSHASLVNRGYDTKFVNAIWTIIQSY